MITTITVTELLPYWEAALRQLHPFVCLPFIIVFSFQLYNTANLIIISIALLFSGELVLTFSTNRSNY